MSRIKGAAQGTVGDQRSGNVADTLIILGNVPESAGSMFHGRMEWNIHVKSGFVTSHSPGEITATIGFIPKGQLVLHAPPCRSGKNEAAKESDDDCICKDYFNVTGHTLTV